MNKSILIIASITIFFSCSKSDSNIIIPDKDKTAEINKCQEKARMNGWVSEGDGKTWLYGGDELTEKDFDISDWTLQACRLRFGYGREEFHALIQPQYHPIDETTNIYRDEDKCIYTVSSKNEVKVYPYKIMREHEIINETIDGHPIAIAYCILADLAIVYSREYCDKTLTFALSGYTYSDVNTLDGLDAFVMWDRETESLWWPLNNESVSGSMLGADLHRYGGLWNISSFKDIVKNYPNASITKFGQSMIPPANWPRTDNPCK